MELPAATTYVSPNDLWGPRGNHVALLPPSPGDVFVVTTVAGLRVGLQPVTKYDHAVRVAHGFVRRLVHPEPITVKVLCLTLPEAQAMGFAPDDLFHDQTPDDEAAMRQAVVTACTDALRNCPDAKVRADALKLLTDLGVMK